MALVYDFLGREYLLLNLYKPVDQQSGSEAPTFWQREGTAVWFMIF